MEPNSPTSDQAFLEELRRHRAELRESMSALEDALAAPATADRVRWAQRVHAALVELSGDFREHIDITEGPDGLYRDLLKTSPRLSDAVASLTREHVLICGQVDHLLARMTAPDATGDVDRDPRPGHGAPWETRPTPPARLRPRLRGLRLRHRGRDLSRIPADDPHRDGLAKEPDKSSRHTRDPRAVRRISEAASFRVRGALYRTHLARSVTACAVSLP